MGEDPCVHKIVQKIMKERLVRVKFLLNINLTHSSKQQDLFAQTDKWRPNARVDPCWQDGIFSTERSPTKETLAYLQCLSKGVSNPSSNNTDMPGVAWTRQHFQTSYDP